MDMEKTAQAMNGPRGHDLPNEVCDWIENELFEYVPVCIAVVDRYYKVISANSRFHAVFGNPIGKHCYQVYKRRNEMCPTCAAMKTMQDGKARMTVEKGVDCVEGTADFVVYHTPIMNESNEVVYIVNMVNDITDTISFQTQYEHLFENAPCSLSVINKDYRIVRANDNSRGLFGDAVGSYCYEIFKKRSEKCKKCPATETFLDGKAHSSTEIRVSNSGSSVYHIVSTTPIISDDKEINHVMEMSLDVTDVHLLSERLTQESLLRKNITESAMDALIAGDEKGVVSIFNSSAERLFGINRTEAIGKLNVERFFPKEFFNEAKMGSDEVLLSDAMIVSNKGERIPVRFSGTILHHENQIIGSSAFFQDLRQIKKLEQDKIESERLAVIGQTASQVAHGIKNILAGMQGGFYDIRIASKKGDFQRAAEGCETAEKHLNRMTEMMRGFLRLSRDYHIDWDLYNVNDIAADVYDLYKETCCNRGINLELNVKPGIPLSMMDINGIKACLENLVSNAMDSFVDDRTTEKRIEIKTDLKEGQIVFEVSDSGCGIDEMTMNRILKSVYSTKGSKGTGLGLLITRRVVEDHKGSIDISSNRGNGTKITFRIPVIRENVDEKARNSLS